MAAYADFTYYTTTYLGTAIVSANFARLALRASAVIDSLTFGRAAPIVTAATDTATIDLIKMATCAVAEEYQAVEQDGSTGGIKSESIGSHSVTYADGAIKTQTSNRRYSNAAALYLGDSGLMFQGFNDDEYGSAIDDD
jgi:hypothetical protein